MMEMAVTLMCVVYVFDSPLHVHGNLGPCRKNFSVEPRIIRLTARLRECIAKDGTEST